jgi:hypothetical protein
MGSMISKNGRLYTSQRKAVFVASDPGCPKVIVTGGKRVLFKDDYSGRLKVGKSLARKLF